MKKILLLFLMFLLPFACADLASDRLIQQRINSIGEDLLNKNRIQKRMIFTYSKESKKIILSANRIFSKRQIIVYDELYKSADTDDELAGALAREISYALKSYSGAWGGRIDSIEVLLGSKKFETFADKRAIDYMVQAGYNPLALIVFINKTCPQKRSDFISRHNLTSKRLARIYEYITYKYPQYLKNNEYIENKYYQNFLLDSVDNRRLLRGKIMRKSSEELDYE